ncbi:dicarboxylate transporter 2.2 [Striga asiatica]|uniref:Dicarboxylate transporter 2.2 n=1 Tax=Striga asiatica TaxID=4170 RepID=A0A5A7P067_STRAF|nr:dicarboxylate transporter 2.2 [Striga asiatica]
MKTTPNAPTLAKQKLEQMGPMKRDEWILIGTLLLTIAFWIAGQALNMPSVVAAMIGLSILMLCGVLDWDDCLSEKQAWDNLAWFAVLIGMATQLTTLGHPPGFLFLHSMASGVPGLLAALALAYNTNLFGALAHYSSGQTAVYYGAGYVELRDVFILGIAIGLMQFVI